MRAIALYTGGKDSHYALMKALEEGIEVVGLV
ncbi:MAG TPA: ATP-binding protein, partial [Acidilobales archaeon]|nr:ATP-binding protein [Acidilobales archaeon]